MRKAFALVALALLLPLCQAAIIKGKLFAWETLEPIETAIINVNSTPPQRVVVENGEYRFSVPKGNYSLVAMQFIGGELARIAREEIEVESDGHFTFDLVLKKATEGDLEEVLGKGFETDLFEEPRENNLLLALVVLGGALTMALYAYKKNKGASQGKVRIVKEKESLDKYALEILDILKRSGNRLTQKELRDKCEGCGEAKISLILTELEALGKIKKIKRGRGNIIILKDL